MEQLNINLTQIMIKLARLQSDVEYIKKKLELEEEISSLELISSEDSVNFFEKNKI